MFILKIGNNAYVKSCKSGELVISSKIEEAMEWETEEFAKSVANKWNRELGTNKIQVVWNKLN